MAKPYWVIKDARGMYLTDESGSPGSLTVDRYGTIEFDDACVGWSSQRHHAARIDTLSGARQDACADETVWRVSPRPPKQVIQLPLSLALKLDRMLALLVDEERQACLDICNDEYLAGSAADRIAARGNR